MESLQEMCDRRTICGLEKRSVSLRAPRKVKGRRPSLEVVVVQLWSFVKEETS
jgi:hypothetical protein